MKTKTKSPKAADDELPRWVPSDRLSMLTGVHYAELHSGNSVLLVYNNGFRISAVVSEDIVKGASGFDLIDAVETAYIKAKKKRARKRR